MASSNSKTDSAPEYEIKHRLAGAVVLVLVAVVVIPLLLSEPAVEANNNFSASATSGEKDFESRIIPLNINNANGASNNTSTLVGIGSGEITGGSSDATVVEDARPALLDLTNDAGGSARDGTMVMTQNEETTDNRRNSGSDESGAENEAMSENDTAATKEKSEPETTATAQSEVPEKTTDQAEANQQNANASQPPKSVEVASISQSASTLSGNAGWVVRVGTFSKSANVESVSSLLTNSGFKPKTTPVSTSLGNSTRVWLGPYAKRETADKISDRLKALTGEKGYVTRTSS